ncbi:MAG: arginine--tRNA ligase, partial [Candidatus Hydrothermae bacterium]|nr:arginine--tRNA ligase [Candidatus Hydrothermae bacterium]
MKGLRHHLEGEIRELLQAHGVEVEVKLSRPPRPGMGDFATNAALLMARTLRRPPAEIAQELADWLQHLPAVARVEATGGFVNLTLKDNVLVDRLRTEFNEDPLPPLPVRSDMRVVVEFVSANPTGPLNVVSARAAAVGDTLVRVMRFAGIPADREYYVNDAGGQIRALQGSLEYRAGLRQALPEDGYGGAYVTELARILQAEHVPVERWAQEAVQRILDGQMAVLRRYRVTFEAVIRESWVRQSPYPAQVRSRLTDYLYEKDGALYFRTTAFPAFRDDKDRVLVKSDGSYTYFASDVVYHMEKFDRGFARVIDVWGADHHGYIPRMKAMLAGLGHPPEDLEVLLIQMVNLLRDGQPVTMGKRSGNFVTLREVINEVGRDACRFMFLLRRCDSPLDFDLELAKQQSTDNPVYYVQYAHARVCSINSNAAEAGVTQPQVGAVDLSKLELAEELA